MPNHVSAYLRFTRTLAGLNRELDALEKRIDSLEHAIVSAPAGDQFRRVRPFADDTAGAA